MKWTTAGAAAAMTLLVAACGYDRDERVGGGAAAGAATGAGVGALGGPVGALAGAGIGGVAGGVTGYATSPEDVNLGRPPWSNPEVRTPLTDDRRSTASAGAARSGSSDVRRAQQALAQRGHDPGPIDGVWGPQTARAMEDFQRANNLQPTGRLDSPTMQALDLRAGTSRAQARNERDRAYMGGGAVGTGAPVGSGNHQPATGGTSTR
jgi:peptidoglycan hydrolase-like protein with peptidoglycan-binding domain